MILLLSMRNVTTAVFLQVMVRPALCVPLQYGHFNTQTTQSV